MSSVRRRVYVDACVLMLAANAREEEVAQRALEVLNADDVVYLYSSIVEMEVMPRPTHNRRTADLDFFNTFFGGAERVPCTEAEQQQALQMMCAKNGLQIIDAVHLSCAVSAGADELVTAEGPTKPMVDNPPTGSSRTLVRSIRVP